MFFNYDPFAISTLRLRSLKYRNPVLILMSSEMTTPDYALVYMGYGERPVPIPSGEKGPKIKEWTTKQFELSDFGEGENIGLRMGLNSNSEFRIALDFDFDVADPERYNKSKS